MVHTHNIAIYDSPVRDVGDWAVRDDAATLVTLLFALSDGHHERALRTYDRLVGHSAMQRLLAERQTDSRALDSDMIESLKRCLDFAPHSPRGPGTLKQEVQMLRAALLTAIVPSSAAEDRQCRQISERLGVWRGAVLDAVGRSRSLYAAVPPERLSLRNLVARETRSDAVAPNATAYVRQFCRSDVVSGVDTNHPSHKLDKVVDPYTGEVEEFRRRVWSIPTKNERYIC